MLTYMLIYNSVCLVALIQETQTDFNDLGKLLLGGVVAAIIFAVGFTFVRFRLREKSTPASDFISISSPREKDSKPGT